MSSEIPNIREIEFEQTLSTIERSLLALKERYGAVQNAEIEQENLTKHRQEIEAQWQENQLPELEQELQHINEQLQELSVTLESHLLSEPALQDLFWKGLRQGILGEAFWQIVRFGGAGLVLGWLLKSWVG
ncbi:MAG: hypothetical protein ACKO2V_25315 [Snowella sp.]|nr:MAG: DUF2203 domain-containing protein [Snowella sp.]